MGIRLSFILLIAFAIVISGCSRIIPTTYNPSPINLPSLSFDAPQYTYIEKQYNDPEYPLPLKDIPDNYERDIVGKFQTTLTKGQEDALLSNGIVILPGGQDRFEDAYNKLSSSRGNDSQGVPILVTTDSVMHLYHIEFNELLKNIEMNKLIPLLNDFLDKSLKGSIGQYDAIDDANLKELARRNIAYLAVAKKLLDPNYDVPSYVQSDVDNELSRIEKHAGLFENELFSKDCNAICSRLLYPADNDKACNAMIKGTLTIDDTQIYFPDYYHDECSKKCSCEDYSQYVPKGHYTESDGLKQYFKSMMWLGRNTFKASGDSWTLQAVLLTDAIKDSDAADDWNRLYSVTGFFAGASDDLTIKDYDSAVFNTMNYGFDISKLNNTDAQRIGDELKNMRGPKILGGPELDLVGTLQEDTQGLRLIGQRYALDSQILSELTYQNVGPNPKAAEYDFVLETGSKSGILTKPKEFYLSCDNMELNRTKYWNEVCASAIVQYCGGQCDVNTPRVVAEKIYDICRLMPTGLDVMSVLGSYPASGVLVRKNVDEYCDYVNQSRKMQYLVLGYNTTDWTSNLYNSWLWMLQPMIKQKSGYPDWMNSGLYQTKELVAALSSWTELRHDTILYVKQSYTSGISMAMAKGPMSSRYYGYVEPNPELYARAKYVNDYLLKQLSVENMLTDDTKKSLQGSSDMMARLEQISDKELSGIDLTEEDYTYIEGIDQKFRSVIQDFASALTVETSKKPIGIGVETHTDLADENDSFVTSMIADVHTDSNTMRALEVGTGNIDWMIVAHKSKDGTIGLAVGPIFSYYEFTQPINDRLADEEWRDMLSKGFDRPNWG